MMTITSLPVNNLCTTDDEVPMGYQQVNDIVCCAMVYEGNFGVQRKVAPLWPTCQGYYAVALLCAPRYSTFAVPL